MNKEYFLGLLVGLCVSIIAVTVLKALHVEPPASIDNLLYILGGAVATAAVPGAAAGLRRVGSALATVEADTQEFPVPVVMPAPVPPSPAQVPVGQSSTADLMAEITRRMNEGK